MPARIASSIAMQLSSANFMGGTTKQLVFDMNGRARQASSPPAIMCRRSMQGPTWCGSLKDVPMCFRRARAGRVNRVEVELEIVREVAGDHRALEEVHVIKLLHDLGRRVEIGERGVAVLPCDRIHHMHGRARRAVVHVGPVEMQVKPSDRGRGA